MQISSTLLSLQSTTSTTSTPPPSFGSKDSQITIGLPVTLVALTLLSWGAFRSYGRYSKKIQKDLSLAASTMPCRKCRYFSNNPYLKCTVSPTKVLTENAIDCPDFCPADRPSTLSWHRR